MKVLLLAASLEEKSGWGRHARAIIDHLRMAGVEVMVFSEEARDDLSYSVYALRSLRSRLPVFAFLRNSMAVRKAAKESDVVHALDGWPLGVYGYFAVLGTRKRFYMNGVGTYSVAPLYSFWKRPVLLSAYRRAQQIFCISAYVRDRIAAGGVSEKQLSVVHFGAPVLHTPSREEQEVCMRQYDLPPNSFPIILTVGAIKDRKGQLVTLRAVARLKENYPHIVYLMAGAGNSTAYIHEIRRYAAEQGMASNIRIIAGADDVTLAFLYARCDVFALNSNTNNSVHHFEGFGAVIVEAAQFGKPAVGSRGCGIEDAIQDGKTGLLTQQEDPADIAEKIEQILAQYERFSEYATRWYGQFRWEKTVSAYIAYYNQKNSC